MRESCHLRRSGGRLVAPTQVEERGRMPGVVLMVASLQYSRVGVLTAGIRVQCKRTSVGPGIGRLEGLEGSSAAFGAAVVMYTHAKRT